MAATKVFSTPELLEAILLDTSFKDVVRASGVSKDFAAVIEGSQKLGEKLFLRASEPTVLTGHRTPRQLGTRSHPCRQVKFAASNKRPGDQLIVKPHPLTEKFKGIFIENNGFKIFVSLARFFAWRQSGNKWQEMLISQPPVTTVVVRFKVDSPGNCSWQPLDANVCYMRIERTGGIRFAHITESLDRYVAGLEGNFEVWRYSRGEKPASPPRPLEGGEAGLTLQDAAVETAFAVQAAQVLTEEDLAAYWV